MDITKENGIATNCNVVESENGTVESKYDFYKYGNTSEFEHFIDLRDSTVLECINLYLLNKSSKIKNPNRQYGQVKKYINDIETFYNIKLKPLVIGDVFWNTFHSYLQEKGLA